VEKARSKAMNVTGRNTVFPKSLKVKKKDEREELHSRRERGGELTETHTQIGITEATPKEKKMAKKVTGLHRIETASSHRKERPLSSLV